MNGTRPTLLVVDDEPEVLHSVHDLFRLQYRVLTFERGQDAVDAMRGDGPIHVVMSDQRMPGMTGVEVLDHAKRLRPAATRLLFTAYADVKAVVDAINLGHVFRYIAKPWDPDELQTVVRQAVAQHELVAERDRLVDELKETNRRLVEADRLKSAFIEVASHELNTPVAVVLGMTQLWKMTQADRATTAERHWVDRIHHAGRRLAGTVERMLKLIRADDFRQPLEAVTVDVGALVRDTVAELDSFVRARGQSVEVVTEPGLGEAEVEPGKVSDALANLVVNAIKFTPDGGTIRVTAGPAGPDHVRVEVADQGAGIDPSLKTYVFEPFFTGFDTMHHSSGEFEYGKRGIGLGLCVVKRFVKLHGGTVTFRSEPGAGTTFVVRLPRRQAAPPPDAYGVSGG